MNWEKGFKIPFPSIQGKIERKMYDLRLGKISNLIFQDKREI